MITDGCVIFPGARVERSVLAPGVRVQPGAVIRESIILTDSVIEAGAVVEQAIIDKYVRISENARVGRISNGDEPNIAMVGKNCTLPTGITVEPGAIIGTDVIPGDFPSPIVRGDDYIQTKRLAYEV
jgi:glucose-1-phosphate adenylyltransferase